MSECDMDTDKVKSSLVVFEKDTFYVLTACRNLNTAK